jgi:hypothetical protein
MRLCRNPHCQKPIVPRDGETPSRVARREFCGKGCYDQSRKKTCPTCKTIVGNRKARCDKCGTRLRKLTPGKRTKKKTRKVIFPPLEKVVLKVEKFEVSPPPPSGIVCSECGAPDAGYYTRKCFRCARKRKGDVLHQSA